jgi:hypothetical protein
MKGVLRVIPVSEGAEAGRGESCSRVVVVVVVVVVSTFNPAVRV